MTTKLNVLTVVAAIAFLGTITLSSCSPAAEEATETEIVTEEVAPVEEVAVDTTHKCEAGKCEAGKAEEKKCEAGK